MRTIINGQEYEKVLLANPDGSAATISTTLDRELVVTNYRVITAFTNASVGDIISETQILDVTGTPSTLSVLWRNQTTSTDISTPTLSNLIALAQTGLTDTQLRASAVPVSVLGGNATAVKVDGTAVIQLGGGTITASTQRVTLASDGPEVTNSTTIATNTGRIPTKGTATMANSTPVTLSTDDTQIGVKATAATIATGGTGIIGWLSDAASSLKGILTVSGTRANDGSGTIAGTSHLTVGGQDGTNLRAILTDSTGALRGTNFQTMPTASLVRASTTVTYASGQLIAQTSWAAMVLTASRLAAGSFILRKLRLRKTSALLSNASFRVHLFSAAPTVSAGDAVAIGMTGVANYLGYTDVTMDQAFTDGAHGSSSMLNDFTITLASGQSIYAVLEARAAYAATSAETFTLIAEVIQN